MSAREAERYLRAKGGRDPSDSSISSGARSVWLPADYAWAKKAEERAARKETARLRKQLYGVWSGMIRRCFDHRSKERYDLKGRTVHAPWQNSFERFAEDIVCLLGERPAGHSLDRIDNDGHYEPGNLRWATPAQQNENRKSRVFGPFRPGRRLLPWRKPQVVEIQTEHVWFFPRVVAAVVSLENAGFHQVFRYNWQHWQHANSRIEAELLPTSLPLSYDQDGKSGATYQSRAMVFITTPITCDLYDVYDDRR